MQVGALRGGEFLPDVKVHHHRHLGVVKARVDAELGFFLPVGVENPAYRPAVAVDHAALERGVDLTWWRDDYVGAQRLEKVAVHRRDADLHAGEIGFVDFLVEVQMKGLVLDRPAEVVHVGFFRPDLVDQFEGAVLALLGHGDLRHFQRVGLGHQVGVEGAGGKADVDHAGLDRIAHLKGRDGLGAADEVDLQRALALLVDLFDPLHKARDVDAVLRKGADRAQRDLLGECARGDEQ